MDWQRQLTTEVTEVISVVWELFLPDLTRGVPEAEHVDKKPDVSLLHLSYFVTLMALYKPRILTHRPRQAEWKVQAEPCSFLAQAGPKSLESLLHHAASLLLVIWSQEEGGCSDAPSARVQGHQRTGHKSDVSSSALPQPRRGRSEPHPLHSFIWSGEVGKQHLDA